MSNASFEDPIGLIFLPSELAKQVQIASYVCIGSVAVSVWDILNNLTLEYRMVLKGRFGPSIIVYFVARLASLGYVLGLALLATYPLGNCGVAFHVIDSFYPLSLASISLLFFFRVRAVYGRTRLVTGIFGLLWLGVLGSAITVPFGGAAISIGPTKYCLISEVDPYVGACAIMVTIHDTAVFLAISYRLVSNTYGVKTRKDLLKTLVSASYLPAFSRSLFVDGQVYYMISVIGSIVVTIMVYANVSPLYRGFLAIPNLSLTSAMACRVYRNTKLGLTRESMNMTLSLPTDTSGGTNPQILSVAFARSGQLMDADGTTDSTEIGDLRRGHSHLQAKSQSIGHDYTGGRTEMV